MKMSIYGTSTTLNTFTLFTGTSFINDCQQQPMLHINHPLLQFADITDPLLSIAALFSRFYSHRIQTWAIKAAGSLISCQMNSDVSLRYSLVWASSMTVSSSPCYTSIIHYFSSLTSRILFWALLHCFPDFIVRGFRP